MDKLTVYAMHLVVLGLGALILGAILIFDLTMLIMDLSLFWSIFVPMVAVVVMILVPNLIGEVIRLRRCDISGKYPKRYFDSLRMANQVVIAVTGVTLGFFKLSDTPLSPQEVTTVQLLAASILAGVAGVVYQITPSIKPVANDRTDQYVSASVVTRYSCYIVTYLQLLFAVAGYSHLLVLFAI